MALQAILKQEAFDSLSDNLKSEYKKQQDGTFLLDVAPVGDFALENVKGLKSALSSERTTREELEKKFKAFDGLEVDKAKDALKKVEEMANWKPEDKVREQIEALKSQLSGKHKKEIDEKLQEIEKFKTAAINSTKGRAIADALAKHKGAPFLADTIEKSVKAEFDASGNVILKVFDEKGIARISNASGSQDLMSIDEYVAELKSRDIFAAAFEGSAASGSGARTGYKSTGTGKYTISAEEARDPSRYRAAKAEAEKAGVQLQIAS